MYDTVIINRRSLSEFPYHDWMDVSKAIIILNDNLKDTPDSFLKHYGKYIFSANFDHSSQVDFVARNFIKLYPISQLICTHERDIMRTQKFRNFAGLKCPYGTDDFDISSYRNKVLMKKLLAKANIPVAPMKQLNNPSDAFDFLDEFGFPVIIKPSFGSSSVGIKIINNEEEMLAVLDEIYSSNPVNNADTPTNYHIEKWIDGDLFHTDGVLYEGKLNFITVSKYIQGCLSFRHGGVTGSYLLDDKNPLTEKLEEFTKNIIKALPSLKFMTFHCEIFVSYQNQLICCEIAARPGGGLVSNVLEFGFDFNINKANLFIQLYKPFAVNKQYVAKRSGCFGWLAIPMPLTPTRLIKELEPCPFPWVVYYKNNLTILNRIYQDNSQSLNFAISFIIFFITEAEFKERSQSLMNWIDEQCIWDLK